MSASSVGATKMRATTSFSAPPPASCTIGATVDTSSADSQLMMAPSPSRPASFSIPSRSAATRIGGTASGRTPRRNPFTLNDGVSIVTFSPENAARRNAITSLVRWYGDSNGMPFQPSTITFDDVPMPSANRPGAASASDAADCAMQAGPRVNAGTIAVPSRSDGAHTDASAKRREGVVRHRLRRPQVRVPEVGQLHDPVPLLVQRERRSRGTVMP